MLLLCSFFCKYIHGFGLVIQFHHIMVHLLRTEKWWLLYHPYNESKQHKKVKTQVFWSSSNNNKFVLKVLITGTNVCSERAIPSEGIILLPSDLQRSNTEVYNLELSTDIKEKDASWGLRTKKQLLQQVNEFDLIFIWNNKSYKSSIIFRYNDDA